MAKRFRPDLDEVEESELNLVPYMDIMLNLIMFMLFSTTSLTQMGVIDISLPQYGGPPVPKETDTPEEEPEVEVTLAVGNEGFTIMANGVEVDGHPGEPTIKRLPAGRWDYEALTKRMEKLKGDYPRQSNLILVASENIEYEVIVAAMDASREAIYETGNKVLFPYVVLSVM